MLGLLWGEGDFERTVLLAVNCGYDTDCTGATAGATFGIIHGCDAIPQCWREPIGETVVASDYLADLPLPVDLDELTQRTLGLSQRMALAWQDKRAPALPSAVEADTVDDGFSWLIESVDACDLGLDAPKLMDPGSSNVESLSLQGIHLDLSERASAGPAAIMLQTHIVLPEDLQGMLMVCASAGITAWLDGRMVLNYHGRRRILPAFHRTEGGGTVPATFKAGKRHLLQIRLIGVRALLEVVAAVGREDGHFAVDTRFEL